jgi:hypothetical protein
MWRTLYDASTTPTTAPTTLNPPSCPFTRSWGDPAAHTEAQIDALGARDSQYNAHAETVQAVGYAGAEFRRVGGAASGVEPAARDAATDNAGGGARPSTLLGCLQPLHENNGTVAADVAWHDARRRAAHYYPGDVACGDGGDAADGERGARDGAADNADCSSLVRDASLARCGVAVTPRLLVFAHCATRRQRQHHRAC